MAKELTTDAFKTTVLDADKPILVDFFATWCPPCKAQLPILEEVAADVGDAAQVYKVNVDQEPALAQLFQVRSIPTLIVFKDGKIAKRFQGLTPRATLRGALS